MKVRIIKTSAGYVPQVQDQVYPYHWESIDRTGYGWSKPENTYVHATYLTQWGAMRTLKKWLKQNVEGTAKLEAFKKELENPNVVYEAEV
jgi:hypothetical protein